MIACSEKSRENYFEKKLLNREMKKPGTKFKPWLVVIGLRTAGPRALSFLCSFTVALFRFSS